MDMNTMTVKDTVEFSGDVGEYKVDRTKVKGVDVIVVTDTLKKRGLGPNDGVDKLTGVEKLLFNDRTVVLDGRNNAPIIRNSKVRTMRAGDSFDLLGRDLLSRAIEFDGQAMTLAGVGPAVNGELTINANKTMRFTATKPGQARLYFTVVDEVGSEARGAVELRVVAALPTDEHYSRQWYHGGRAGIRSQLVWDSGITGKGVEVRVNDDFLQLDHPDYKDSLRLDQMYDYANNDNDPSPVPGDVRNHGTFCLGTIASGRDNGGIVGVAYNARLRFGAMLSQSVFHNPRIMATVTYVNNTHTHNNDGLSIEL